MKRLLLLAITASLFCSGCAHRQLTFNTVQHAETLTDLYEKQVLNNLARFSENPESLPHFEIPTSGGTNVNDTNGFSASPLNVFRESAGITGSRTHLNAWILEPVTDPDRLRRMKCAFQRAVSYQASGCTDCCELEAPFLRGTQVEEESIFDANGRRTIDRVTGKPYPNVTTLSEVQVYGDPHGQVSLGIQSVYRPIASGVGDPINPVLVQRCKVDDKGNEMEGHYVWYNEYSQGVLTTVSKSSVDCDGPCSVQPCFFKKSRNIVLANSQSKRQFGSYRGNHVWVPQSGQAEFGKLVLTILEYATTDPPAAVTKQVTLYLDHTGAPSDRNSASQVIQRTIPASNRNIALETGKIANEPTQEEQTLQIIASLLQEAKRASSKRREIERPENAFSETNKRELSNLDALDKLWDSQLESIKISGSGLFKSSPPGFLNNLINDCEKCVREHDENSINEKLTEIRARIRLLPKYQTRSREAQTESNKIQRAAPLQRSNRRGGIGLRELSLEQEILLPSGQ